MKREICVNKNILRLALTCAVVAGSISFANSAKAIDISDSAGLQNSSNYTDGAVLNIVSDIEMSSNLPAISNAIDVEMSGDNHLINHLINGSDHQGYQFSNGANFSISNLTFDNFQASEIKIFTTDTTAGSVLFLTDSTAVLNNVNIKNSESTISPLIFATGNSHGGAIANLNGTLTIVGSSIASNTANVNRGLGTSGNALGGAIYNTGTLNIKDSDLTGNKTVSAAGNAYGGAIYNAGTINISGTSFSGNTQGSEANDIYFAQNSVMNVEQGNAVTIGSGIASADTSANINIKDGGNLVMADINSSGYSGNVNVESNGVLTYKGDAPSLNQSVVQIAGDLGGVEYDLNNDFNFTPTSINTKGYSARIIKSGTNTMNLNGDYSSLTGEIIANSGAIIYSADDINDKFLTNSTTILNNNSQIMFDISSAAGDSQSAGNVKSNSTSAQFIKTGDGNLNLVGDNSGFSGNVQINQGTLTFNEDSTDIFFSSDTSVDINNSELVYHAKDGAKSLGSGSFSNLALQNGGTFNYNAGAGETSIDGGFMQSDGTGNTLVFSGNQASSYILNTDFSTFNPGDTINFANTVIKPGSTSHFKNNIVLDNTTLNLMDAVKNSYTFDNLTLNNAKLSLDVSLGETPSGDILNIVNGNGTINLTALSILEDNGMFPEGTNKKTVQVIKNTNGSVGLSVADPDDLTLAAWSTNVYEYDIKAGMTAGSSVYDAIDFVGKQAADANSLKKMNNYTAALDRGFSIVDGASVYYIDKDLEKTEKGSLTVKGISADESIISGLRNGVGDEKGSFFELTDAESTTLNLSDVTIQDADRVQATRGGSVIYANSANAFINVDNVNIRDSHSVGNGGAFDIENAQSVIIEDADFSGNSSDSLGGAIYTNSYIGIINSNFEDNKNQDIANDIYITENGNINFTTGSSGNTISSGLAGKGVFAKSGTGALNLSGVNKDFEGSMLINDGIVNYVQSNGGSFVGGSVKLAGNTELNIENSSSDNIRNLSSEDNSSVINKTGNGILNSTGDNSGYTGTVNVSDGELSYTAEDEYSRFFSPQAKINLSDGTKLTVDTNSQAGQKGGNISSETNNAQFDKIGAGDFALSGTNDSFTGDLNIKQGSLTFTKKGTTSFVNGNTNISNGAALNYIAESGGSINNLTNAGTLAKLGDSTLTIEDYNFNGGVAEIYEGTLKVLSKSANAKDFDFKSNIYENAVLDYVARGGSGLTLDASNSNLNFVNANSNATAMISNADILLGILNNSEGNNIILNNSSITPSVGVTDFSGANYTFKNSEFKLMNNDINTSDYLFSNLNVDKSNLTLDVSLGETLGGDTLNIASGSGEFKISGLAIIDDNGIFSTPDKTKTIQVIKNGTGSVGIDVPEDGTLTLADWSTNVYEYSIEADKSIETSSVYDSIKFIGQKEADSNSLKKMNNYSGVRGFSVVNSNTYYIDKDLETTFAGDFTVTGKDKNSSVISGKRNGSDSDKGSFFEITEDNTNFTLQNLTIQDADRTNQLIKGGSVLYADNGTSDIVVSGVNIKNNHSAGNGGAFDIENVQSVIIKDSDFSGNISDSLGGAIYANSGVDIINSNFENNKNNTISNDIYITESGIINYTTGDAGNIISSGLAGKGIFAKAGDAALNLSGINKDFEGLLQINDGAVNYTQSNGGSYIGGITQISSNGVLNFENSDVDNIKSLASTDTGATFNKTGAGNLIMTGKNSQFSGSANVKEGTLTVDINSAGDTFFGENSKTEISGGAALDFDISEGNSFTVNNNGNLISGTGVVEKLGNGTLILKGDNSGLNTDNIVQAGVNNDNIKVGTIIKEGVLNYIAESSAVNNMISGGIDIQSGTEFKVTNNSGADFNLFKGGDSGGVYNDGLIGNGIFSTEGDIVLSGNNSNFTGRTNIEDGILSYTKSADNSFMQGVVNIAENGTLEYSTANASEEVITNLVGSGIFVKELSGTVNIQNTNSADEYFTGIMNVNGGTLNVKAADQLNTGKFNFGAVVNNDANLIYTAGLGDNYIIDSSSSIKFANTAGNAGINFVNGTYDLISDVNGAAGNNIGFDSAKININGTNYAGNYSVNNSNLNLADGSISSVVFNQLSTTGTNNLDIDFSFNGAGSIDMLTSNVDKNGQVVLNNINAININEDKGFLSGTYTVLDNLTFINDYNKEISSNIYKYIVDAQAGGTDLTFTAAGYVGNTLYTLNHLVTEERTFKLAGSNEYYIGQNLESTLTGTLNILGRTNNRADTIIAKADADSSGLSMFELTNPNTVLNIKDITIKDAYTAASGAVIYADAADTFVNIENTTFDNNMSEGKGGVVYNGAGTTAKIVNSTFSNNVAVDGAAIYNLGKLELSDVVFKDNLGDSYIYNATGGLIDLNSTKDYEINNGYEIFITNNGTLNIFDNGYKVSIYDPIASSASSKGTINTDTTLNLFGSVSEQVINVNGLETAIKISDPDMADYIEFSENTLNIAGGAAFSDYDRNITGGVINNSGIFNIYNDNDITISSDIKGSGVFNKTVNNGKLTLSGINNREFNGTFNIEKGIVEFIKTNNNSFFDKTANINVEGTEAEFDYTTNETEVDLNSDFSKINLTNGGKVQISGNGAGNSQITLNSGWVNSDASTNNLVFNRADYIVNTTFEKTTGNLDDNIIFSNSNVKAGTGLYDSVNNQYDFGDNVYTLDNSVLDLSDGITAGDVYHFDTLNMSNDSKITLDVNLYLDDANDPYADTIFANQGSGIANITKLYITDDNGKFKTNDAGVQTKGPILVFDGGNDLQVAVRNDIQILSWATNVYKYGIKSAQTNREADSIEVLPNGPSSTDTLRDLNWYDGNRGFSFIVVDDNAETNRYNIFRDLDTTADGNFTVVGNIFEGEKSILDGTLTDLYISKDEIDSDTRLRKEGDVWYYYEADESSRTALVEGENIILDTEGNATIKVSAFTLNGDTQGSMFELVNNTSFEMSDVSVENAKRYLTDTIKNGSAIYASNSEATVKLNNVDFKNNEVEAGNGGAIANINSKTFILNNSVLSGNKSSGDGGAFYNTSNGETVLSNIQAENNTSTGFGGAIYTSADMTITNGVFANNKDSSGANDIYIDNSKLTLISTEGNISSIGSGITGIKGASVVKDGAGDLNISGSNSGFEGQFDIINGNVNYKKSTVNDSFISGYLTIAENAILSMDVSDGLSDSVYEISGFMKDGIRTSGTFVKSGKGTVNLFGENSRFGGQTQITEGSLVYNAENDSDRYFGGSTVISQDADLTLNISDVEGQTLGNISSKNSGDGSIIKNGLGNITLNGDNSGFSGTTTIDEGTITYAVKDATDKYFGGNTVINPNGTLKVSVPKNDTQGIAVTNQTIGNISGYGNFIVDNNDGRIQLINDNSNFDGYTIIESGVLAYTSGNGSYVNGRTEIREDGTLEYTVNSGSDNLNNFIGKGTLDKLGAGTLNLTGDNSAFEGIVNITKGILAYTSSADNKFINAKEYNINGDLKLSNVDTDLISIQNVSGSGNINKLNNGNLALYAKNENFTGNLNIHQGAVLFEKTQDTSYIKGNTVISTDGSLNYTTTIDDILENVSGSGTLNKNGAAKLTFNAADNAGFNGTAVVNDGLLETIGANTGALDFNTKINSGKFNYTAADGASLAIGGSGTPKVAFGQAGQNAIAQFNNGIYTIAGDILNITGNNVVFDNSTIKLSQDTYSNGNYTIQNSIIDLANGLTETKTFGNLTTDNAHLKMDVDLTLPNAKSDQLIANSGSGTLQIVLTDIKVLDKTDNGLNQPNPYIIKVLGGGLTFDEDKSLGAWSTDVYEYDVQTKGQNLTLTAIKAATNKSLKAMNDIVGTRGFQFTSNDGNPYKIAESLGTTQNGIFTVNGVDNGSTVISGEDSKSLFEVTQKTDLTVNNLTITDAKGSNGSALIANNSNANVNLNNVSVTSSSSTGNGGAVNNTNSNSFIVNGGAMSNNVSGGKGGAVYTSDNMTIIDTNFANNKDSNGANDIYIEGANAAVNYISNNNTNISSGIAGNGSFNKSGNGTLNLSGKNDNFSGNLNIAAGNVNFKQNSTADSYISGNTNINKNSSLTLNTNLNNITTGAFGGAGTINKDGAKNVQMTGDNSGFSGNLNINSGSVSVDTDNNKYINGTTNINQNGRLVVNTNNGVSISKINGNGILSKGGDGALVMTGNNSGFSGTLDITNGTFGMAAGSSIGNLSKGIFADGTSINLQNTSVVQRPDGTYTTNPSPASLENLHFNNLTLNGNTALNIDVDLKNSLADKIGADTVSGGGHLVLGQNSLNVVSDSLLNDTSVQIAYGALANGSNIILSNDAKAVMGPIQKYDVTYLGGNLGFTRQGGTTPEIESVNPAVMASSVATQVGGFLTQLETLHSGFYHMDRYTKYAHSMRLSAEYPNTYAVNDNAQFRRSELPLTSNAMWVKPYTSFEKVQLRGGVDVSNVTYGTLYGGDSDLYDLGNGYKGIISAFVGYNGSHQSYNGISMNQQGGTLGVTGTLYKGNFFTGLTVSTGASAGEAYTNYGRDHFSMITAGVASKTGYNWELKEGRMIVQPSLFMGYTFVNTFDYTNAAGVRVNSDPLNAIQIVPGIKVIGNLKNGWQPYAGVDMVWNIMGSTDVMANDIRLPQLSVKPYVQYGVGVQKSWGDRFTAFFQTMLRNGGRNGVVLSGGMRWTLGKDVSKETVKAPAKEIKVSKPVKASKQIVKSNNNSKIKTILTGDNDQYIYTIQIKPDNRKKTILRSLSMKK